ncbi:MAG: mechanosensitive ion channel domain-containing protein [Bacteroidota bacterium]
MDRLNQFLNFSLLEIDNQELKVYEVLGIILILVLARFSIWLIRKLINRNLAKKRLTDEGRRYAVVQISRYFIYITAILLCLELLNVPLTWVVTSSTALLVGIGFGLQDTFRDFLSGIILLFEASIGVNDVVQIGDLIGQVRQIGIRTTEVQTREGIKVIVPNAKLTNDNIINWSHGNRIARFSIFIGVAYGSNVQLVMETLETCAQGHNKVLNTPNPQARFLDFGDSALNFEVLFWTRDPFHVEFTKSDIRVAIDAAFRENEINIPFPQRDLHIKSDDRNGKTSHKEIG